MPCRPGNSAAQQDAAHLRCQPDRQAPPRHLRQLPGRPDEKQSGEGVFADFRPGGTATGNGGRRSIRHPAVVIPFCISEGICCPLVIGRDGPRFRECQTAAGTLFAEQIPGQNLSGNRFAVDRHLGTPCRDQQAVDAVRLVRILAWLVGDLDRLHDVGTQDRAMCSSLDTMYSTQEVSVSPFLVNLASMMGTSPE